MAVSDRGSYPANGRADILKRMKTTIDVDRDRAREAAEVLGTSSLKDTVNEALLEVVKAARRRELAEAIRNGTLSVPTPEELEELRSPRLQVGAMDGLLDDLGRC
jgi:Arc/MetJ family transcription regulator